MIGKKILVYGAGPLGSLFAARLQESGNNDGRRLMKECT